MNEGPDRRARGRWRTATLVAWLGLPSLATAAAPASRAEIDSRFAEGKQRFQDKQYLEAAEIFTEVLGKIEEVLLNRPSRENVMSNILIAYEWAYRASGRGEDDKDVSLLDAGQRVLDGYRAELARVYPSHAEPSQSLVDAIARFEEARRIAHEAHDSPTEPVEVGPCLSPPPPPPIVESKGCGSNDDSSIAWLGVLALPLVRRRRGALERLAERLPPDVVQRLRARPDDDDERS